MDINTQRALFMEMNSNCSVERKKEIKNLLILGNMDMVISRAKKYALDYNIDSDILEGYGYEGLLLAINGYDVISNGFFSVYAGGLVDKYILRGVAIENGFNHYTAYFKDFDYIRKEVEIKKGKSLKSNFELIYEIANRMREVLGEDEYIYERFINHLLLNVFVVPSDCITSLYNNPSNEIDSRIYVEEILENLTSSENFALSLKYGIFDGKKKTYEEVSSKMNISRERVRQLEKKALYKLKNPRGKLKSKIEII